MKRLLSFLLILCIVCTLLPVGALAAPSSGKLAALTFDDGPGRYTARLLDALDQRDAKVTFFVLGQQAKAYPEIVRRAYDAGHQIASHTYSHRSLTGLSAETLYREVSDTAAVLNAAIGCSNTYLIRPPYGNYNQTVLSRLGAPAVYWSVDPQDWNCSSASTVYSRVMNSVRDGSIILLHDIHSHSVTAAIDLVDALIAKGYELVTVNELCRRRGITMRSGSIYFDAYPNGTQLPAPAAPEISVRLTGGVPTVTITAEPGTAVYYSTDGTAPTGTSTRYTGPFSAAEGAEIRAFCAYDKNGGRSKTTSLTVEGLQTAPPVLSVEDGLCTVTADAPGDRLLYTLDGSAPQADSPEYREPIALTPGTTVTAAAFSAQYGMSESTWITYSDGGHVFRDVRMTDLHYTDIDAAYTAGMMDGVGGDRFMPDMATNRATIVTILYRLAGRPDVASTVMYSDVPENEWYADALCWATENGIIDGFADGTFRGKTPLTREQAAAILFRYANVQGADTSARACASDFADIDAVNGYALEPLLWATAKQYILPPSDGRLEPRGSISRAELARLVMRALEL